MKALSKSTVRFIRRSTGRFVAIFAIIALGVGFFSGLTVTQTAMLETGNKYLAEHKLYDFRVVSTLGFDAEDEKAIAENDCVEKAAAAKTADALCRFEGDTTEDVVTFRTVTEGVNNLELKSGRLPHGKDECVLDARYNGEETIGRKLTIAEDNPQASVDALASGEYTIVGIVNSPLYLNFERGASSVGTGSVFCFAYTADEGFAESAYSEIYIKLNESAFIYSGEYKAIAEKYEDDITRAAQDAADARRQRLQDEIQAEYDKQTEAAIAEATAAAAAAGIPAEQASAMLELPEIPVVAEPQVYVLGRDTNTGYACFENDSAIVEGIAKVFPAFFFLVAALVCITTMTRMVEENRTHIGTLKALGYRNYAIASQYIVYSGTAAMTGAVAGYYLGSILFPVTIWSVYAIMYGFAPLELVFDVRLFIISAAVALLCSVGTSLIAAARSLGETAAALIRPKSPKSGKRILLEHCTFIWRRLKFLYKVSFRNVFRYKSRMIMMILGVGGCTALLLTGFGLSDSIKNIAGFQFDEITVYDYSVTFSDALDEDGRADIERDFDAVTDGIMFNYTASVDITVPATAKDVRLVAAENSSDGFIDLHDGDKKIAYPAEGEVVLTRKLAEKNGIKNGERVTLRRADMSEVTLTVTGVCDNYLFNYAYVNFDTCRNLWHFEPEIKNAFVIAAKGSEAGTDSVHESAAAFSADGRCMNVVVNSDRRSYMESMMESLNYIVLLICACAAALAFVVVFNLTGININERAREIATIKVLGFRRGETGAYVFRENLTLAAVGGLVGLPLGMLLHAYVMSCIDIDMVAFNIHIAPQSYLISFAMTLAFACIVDFIMMFRLEKIDMANSLKSIE